MTARFLASLGESSHLPAWETWIQRGGLRKLDSSFGALPIVRQSVREAPPEIIWRRGTKHSVTSVRRIPP